MRLPKVTRRSFAVWVHDFLIWRRYYKSSVLLNFGEPVLNLVALGWGLGAYVTQIGEVSFLQFIAPGLLAVTTMNAVTFDICYEGYDRLRRTGTYTAMTSTSMETEEMVGGEVLWEVTRSLLYGAIFLTVLLAFGLVRSWWTLAIVFPLVLSGILFALLGLVVVSQAQSYEHLFYYFTLIVTPMFMFSGVFFPVDRLPEALQWVVRCLPLYHVVELNRALVIGNVDSSLLAHVGALLLMIAVVAPFPAPLMKRALEKL